MKYFIVKNIVLVLTLSLVACASIFSEKSQSISVDTGDIDDATCELFNGKGRYIVNSPGTLVIGQSCDDLNYICRKKGYNEIKDASIEDGGSGAFYIFLKKNRSIK